MSYNIDTWKTKELDGFAIPLSAFYESHRVDWHPERANHDDGTVTLCGGCGTCDISGRLGDDGFLEVSDIDICGEGSGAYTNIVLEPAFMKSRGKLVAKQVWEGGDSITSLLVENGAVTWEGVEL